MEIKTRFSIGDEAWQLCKYTMKARKGAIIGIEIIQEGSENRAGKIVLTSQRVNYTISTPIADGKQSLCCSKTFLTKEDLINSI